MWSVLVLCVIAACGGGSSSASSVCSRLASNGCARAYECYTTAELASHGLPATELECVTQAIEAAGCSTATWEDLCPSGSVADVDRAEVCAGALGDASCADLEQPDFGLDECTDVCVYGDDETGLGPDAGGSGELGGVIDASWTIRRESGSTSCGVDWSVAVYAEDIYSGVWTLDYFDCEDHHGVTNPYPFGGYQVAFYVYDALEQPIGYTPIGSVYVDDGAVVPVAAEILTP